MQAQISAARWAAVRTLQKIRDRRASDSFEFDIADHAIELILNPGRAEGPYLIHNALRDARSVIIRQKRRAHQRGMLPLLGGQDNDDPLELSRTIQCDRTVEASRPQSVEVEIGWKQEFHQLQNAVSRRNPRAGEILNSWRDGEDIAEAAERLQISTHYTKKLRNAIRRVASGLAAHGKAA